VWYTGKVWLKVPETIKVVFYGKLNKHVYGKDLILYLIGKIGVDGANYKSLEFTGEIMQKIDMAGRFSMSNMAIEAGGKNGITQPDKTTMDYVKKHGKNTGFKVYSSDSDANYCETVEIDCTEVQPQVSMPHLPSNAKNVTDVKNVHVDQVVIGSCTNGWIEDLRIAAKILKNKKVSPNVRLLIFPATPAIYRQAIKEGLFDVFLSAGGIICPPTCGPCLGGHLGILAKGERCIATTNRNFVGRMGHLGSEVVLSNPAVAAASAIKGKISLPEDK
jgi:3-isopropylmalate/(R)-2-methylmalate dehydratase large subunit